MQYVCLARFPEMEYEVVKSEKKTFPHTCTAGSCPTMIQILAPRLYIVFISF